MTPAIWLAHTRADTYPEPFAFRPERFLENAPSTYAWIPFGGGVRRCIGAAFAEMEMRVALERDPAPAHAAQRDRPARARRPPEHHDVPAHGDPRHRDAPVGSHR